MACIVCVYARMCVCVCLSVHTSLYPQLRPLQHQYEKYLQLFEPVGPELSLAFTNTAFANFIQSAMQRSTVHQTIHNFVLLPREVRTAATHLCQPADV